MFKKQKAFTLVELMITLAVLAVVLGIAVPSFNAMIIKNSSALLGGEMVTALNYARTEAIKRAGLVSICPSTDGATCAGTGDWAKGWLVFTDTPTIAAPETPIVGVVLRSWSDVNAKSVITVKKGTTDVNYVRFTGLGILARNGATDTNPRTVTAYITGCKSDSSNTITIGILGMVSLVKANCP